MIDRGSCRSRNWASFLATYEYCVRREQKSHTCYFRGSHVGDTGCSPSHVSLQDVSSWSHTLPLSTTLYYQLARSLGLVAHEAWEVWRALFGRNSGRQRGERAMFVLTKRQTAWCHHREANVLPSVKSQDSRE